MKKLLLIWVAVIQIASGIFAASSSPAFADTQTGAGTWINRLTISYGGHLYVDNPNDSNKNMFLVQNSAFNCKDIPDFIQIPDLSHPENGTFATAAPQKTQGGKCTPNAISLTLGNTAAEKVYFSYTAKDEIVSVHADYKFTNDQQSSPSLFRKETSDRCPDILTTSGDGRTGSLEIFTKGSHDNVDFTSQGYYEDIKNAISPKQFPSGLIDTSRPIPATAKKNPSTGSDCYSRGTANVTMDSTPDKPGDPSGATKTTTTPNSDAPTCDAGFGFTWIVCPMLDGAITTINYLKDQILIPFLEVRPLAIADPSDPIYQAWNTIRNIANVAFILIFLLIIFGTTLNIDAYTVKKVLPRLVAAAVLVQFSFLLSGILVDIGNVSGAGIKAIIPMPHDAIDFSSSGAKVGLVGAGAIGGIAIAAVIPQIAAIGVVTIVGALLAVLAFFFTILLRQALILMLIVLSPLAFVAWVLPNTEGYFKKWYRMFFRLIIMYPLIQLIFIASSLLCWTIAHSTNGFAQDAIGGMMQVGALFLPLFMVPGTIKASDSVLNKGANAINGLRNRTKKAVDNSQFAKDQATKRKEKNLQRYGEADTTTLGGKVSKRLYRARAGFGFRSSTVGDRTMYSAVAAADAEAQKAFARKFDDMTVDEVKAFAADMKPENANARKAAISHLSSHAEYDKLAEAREAFIASSKAAGKTDKEAQDEWVKSVGGNYSDLKSKAVHALSGTGAFDNMTAAQLNSSAPATREALGKHIAAKIAAGDTTAADRLVSNLEQLRADPNTRAQWNAATAQKLLTAATSGTSPASTALAGTLGGLMGADGRLIDPAVQQQAQAAAQQAAAQQAAVNQTHAAVAQQVSSVRSYVQTMPAADQDAVEKAYFTNDLYKAQFDNAVTNGSAVPMPPKADPHVNNPDEPGGPRAVE